MINLNYQNAIGKVDNTLHQWKRRNQTLFGKITGSKLLGLSKQMYFLMNIPRLPDKKLNEINNVLYMFVWNNRKDKIKREILIQPYKDGGVGMMDGRQFDEASRLT